VPYGEEVNPAVHAYLSIEAKTAWQQMAEDNGVSTTGLMEALGLEWLELIREHGGEADGLIVPLVKAARKIDASRRRRGRNR
jgi:hypothetical protein